jgi:hypothetical protein
MATVNLGRIKPVFKGAYSGGTAYVVDDIVTSGNETFICIQASTGNATSSATYWTKLAAKGTDGTDGTDLTSTLTTRGDIVYKGASALTRLPKGTAGYYLKQGANDPEWGALASGGKIAQVVRMDYIANASVSGSSTVYNNTGVTLSITPSATSSKIFGMTAISTGVSSDVFSFTDVKNITSGTIVANRIGKCSNQSGNRVDGTTHMFLDSPNSTSAQTYTVRGDSGGATLYINSRDGGNLDNASGMMLMEVLV